MKSLTLRTKIVLPLSIIFALNWPGSSRCAPPILGNTSKISTVTVYKDRAFVERQQEVSIPAGPATITFDKLSPMTDKDSIKVHLSQSKATDILSIRAESQYLLKSENAELNQLREHKEQLHDQNKGIMNEVRQLLQLNSHLENLSQHYRDSFALKLHQNQWTKPSFIGFLDFLSKRSSHLQSAWKKLYIRHHEISQKIEELDAKIAGISNSGDQQYLRVYIDVLTYSPTQQKVQLSYLVPNASWTPAYDLRIESKKGTAHLEQYALVKQNTGEDWTNVTLQLSNVRSELRPQAPIINSYTIHGREVNRVITSVGSVKDDSTSLTTGDSSGSEKGSTELEKTFTIFGTQTVLQSLNTTKVLVARASMKYDEYLELVAAQYPFVYRKAEFNNPFAWTLTGGPFNLFYDGQFFNQSWLEDVAKGNAFAINAGVDHNVVVDHSHKDRQENPGLIDQRKHYHRKYVTSVTNYGSQAKRIRWLSQIPVSQMKEVEVAVEKETTAGFIKDSEHESWIYWDATLPSRQTVTRVTAIAVATPKDFNFRW